MFERERPTAELRTTGHFGLSASQRAKLEMGFRQIGLGSDTVFALDTRYAHSDGRKERKVYWWHLELIKGDGSQLSLIALALATITGRTVTTERNHQRSARSAKEENIYHPAKNLTTRKPRFGAKGVIVEVAPSASITRLTRNNNPQRH